MANAISGRGIGLDVVRDHINQLQGQIFVRSDIGQGTTFELIVPISLSTIRCMMVVIGDEYYAIPTNNIHRVIEADAIESFTVGGKNMLRIDDKAIPQHNLIDILQRTPRIDVDAQFSLIVRVADRLHALMVDDIIEEQEVVVRTLNPELQQIPHISGATLLADGRVVLILDMGTLLKNINTMRRRAIPSNTDITPEIKQQHRILVVDDSITTRTLQKNILEAAGYDILTATHGLEALELLTAHKVDLVISDVEMPWLNGFELTQKIRQQQNLQDTPIILVTSLDSDEHRRRGMHAGADAYIPKGVFDQNELLTTIRQLL